MIIQRAQLGRPSLDVLDLGGGTGREIATHLADDPAVRWTYVDFCPAMAAQFRSNLVDDPVLMTVRVVVEDILQVHASLPASSYDVVLLSLVSHARAAGLAHQDTLVIRRDGASYVFVAMFTPAAIQGLPDR